MREGSGQTVGEGLELEDHRGESLSLTSVPLPSPVFELFLLWACRQGSPQLPPSQEAYRTSQWEASGLGGMDVETNSLRRRSGRAVQEGQGGAGSPNSSARALCCRGTPARAFGPQLSGWADRMVIVSFPLPGALGLVGVAGAELSCLPSEASKSKLDGGSGRVGQGREMTGRRQFTQKHG